jgi:hypothetical protein
MFIVMNRFRVITGEEAGFEQLRLSRDSRRNDLVRRVCCGGRSARITPSMHPTPFGPAARNSPPGLARARRRSMR